MPSMFLAWILILTQNIKKCFRFKVLVQQLKVWILWAKEELLKKLKPIFSGGGAIWYVNQNEFTHSEVLPDKFEPGTPNLSGAVSLLKAFEYVESIWGYEVLEKIEHELVAYALEKFSQNKNTQRLNIQN